MTIPFRPPAVLAAAILAAAVLAGPGSALAQGSRARPAPPAATAAPANPASPAAPTPAVPAIPQQTTASFADWVLRCTRANPSATACEVVQGVQRDDKPVAQIALGRAAKGQPFRLTVLVPASASFGQGPVLLPGREGEGATVAELAWRRCVPGGCIADAALSEDALHKVRGWTEIGRIAYVDGAGRAAVLPFSPLGLPQALDALAKEDGG